MKVTEKQIEKALRACLGLRSMAADKLGITPSALTQRIQKSSRLKQAIEDSLNRRLDLGEFKLMEAVNENKPWAIKFLLTGRRGYLSKEIIEKENVKNPDNVILINLPDNGRN